MTDQRIAIVTGANNGIGFETARGMANAGYVTIMACRSLPKAEEAAESIRKALPQAQLEVMELDLSDLQSVRTFADAFRDRFPRLNILINNAGILSYSPKTNTDGIELQFATNHLGHFLLTALLFDTIPDDPTSRIVSLSSVAHKGASIDFDDLSCDGNGGRAYGQSKLACLIFAEELDRRLRASGSQIRSVPVHPGGSDSGLFEEMGRLQYLVLKVLAPFISHSNASAAKPSLFAALDPTADGGTYYGPQGYQELRGRVATAKRDPGTCDTQLAAQLWTISEILGDQTFMSSDRNA